MSDTNLTPELNEDGSPKMVEATIEPTAEEIAEAHKAAQATATSEPPKELTDEEYLAEHNKRFKTEFKSLDDLKPKAPEPTEAEKLSETYMKDKKVLDKFLELHKASPNFKSIDESTKFFNSIKDTAKSNLEELSKMKVVNMLLEEGMSKEDAEEEVKKRYYQYSDAEILELEEEAQAVYTKNRELGKKRLSTAATQEQIQAQKDLQYIQGLIDDEEELLNVDSKLAQEAQVIGKTFERKIITPIEIKDGIAIAPFEDELSESALAEIVNKLSDRKLRDALFYKEDGTENIAYMAELLSYKARYEGLAQKAAYSGLVAATEYMRTKFPDQAKAVYSSPTTVIAQPAGKVEKFSFSGPGIS